MPFAMVLPEPVLLVTAGTSLPGLKPTATSVPAGHSANLICAACVDRAVATIRANSCFILPGLVCRVSSVGTQQFHSTETESGQEFSLICQSVKYPRGS